MKKIRCYEENAHAFSNKYTSLPCLKTLVMEASYKLIVDGGRETSVRVCHFAVVLCDLLIKSCNNRKKNKHKDEFSR